MGIYQNLYTLLEQYIYGGTMTADATLICTLMATIGSVFVVALPFALVWKIIKMIMG